MLPETPGPTAQRLFDAAAAVRADERSAYLQRECSDNPALLAKVQALLAGAGVADTLTPGQVVGAWRIVGVIGRGGMGVVYSLGVLFYVLLTGRRPYRLSGSALRDLDRALRQTTVSPPSTAVRRPEDEAVPVASRRPPSSVPADALRGDLDAIVMKALARDPAERYATVGQLADDLARHRTQHPVSARRAHPGYRARCFVRRHALASVLSIVVALLLLGGSGVVLWQARATADARALAERRFNDIGQLAGVFMFDVHDAIVNVPGTTGPARSS